MVDSPCKHICTLDDKGVCIGCFRTRDEISRWRGMTDEEKLKVLERIKNEKSKK